jgi:glycosyltransferase involved in cell wall biosynthesis
MRSKEAGSAGQQNLVRERAGHFDRRIKNMIVKRSPDEQILLTAKSPATQDELAATPSDRLARYEVPYDKQSDLPSVSLVITSYNHGQFLAEAIESALSQTRRFHEILVIDDGSTDDTAAVAARYPGVQYIWQENRGLAAARNAGLRRAQGRFVVFLDADDYLRPEAVDAGLKCANSHPTASFVYGRYHNAEASGESLPAEPLHACGPDPYLEFLRGNCIGMHATVMYRRSAIHAVGGFREELKACEDYDIFLRIARQGNVACHDVVVAAYRRHAANMSGNVRLMLLTSIGVLTDQWPHVQPDPVRRGAYREGLRHWKKHYGAQLARHIRRQFGAGASYSSLLRDVSLLVTDAPHAFIAASRKICRKGFRKLGSRLPFGFGGRFVANRVPPRGRIAFGDLRRLEPFSRDFGYARGTPVDRYYIERFLSAHSVDIRERVLEIGDNTYTRRFGGARVASSDVLNVHPGDPTTTIVSDLTSGAGIADESFDCVIVTQTLHLLWDMQAAVRTLYRILKPGGILLLTVPGTISQLEQGQWRSTWYWGLGLLAVERLFGLVFAPSVQVTSHGNVLASIAFLHGIASEELEPAELDHRDALYPLLITVRAVKP